MVGGDDAGRRPVVVVVFVRAVVVVVVDVVVVVVFAWVIGLQGAFPMKFHAHQLRGGGLNAAEGKTGVAWVRKMYDIN